jgi:hypothetical protein
MQEPDYSKNTKAELADILEHIDRERFPKRTARAQEEYDSRGDGTEFLGSTKNEVEGLSGKIWSSFIVLVGAPFVLIYGIQSDRLFYSVNIESLWARVIAFITMLILGLLPWLKTRNK